MDKIKIKCNKSRERIQTLARYSYNTNYMQGEKHVLE